MSFSVQEQPRQGRKAAGTSPRCKQGRWRYDSLTTASTLQNLSTERETVSTGTVPQWRVLFDSEQLTLLMVDLTIGHRARYCYLQIMRRSNSINRTPNTQLLSNSFPSVVPSLL